MAIGYTQLHGYRVYTVHSYTAIGYTQLHGYRVYTAGRVYTATWL
jgi:hypothetical protein